MSTNKFNLRGPPPTRREDRDGAKPPTQRKPNAAILEHNKKREIELQVEQLREQLEDEGLPEDDIEEKLAEYRRELQSNAAAFENGGHGRPSRDKLESETHQMAVRKAEQMNRLREAFGYGEDIPEGEAFDQELQARRREERAAEREARQAEMRRIQRGVEKAREKAERERRREEKERARERKEEPNERGADGRDWSRRPPSDDYEDRRLSDKRKRDEQYRNRSGDEDAEPQKRGRNSRDDRLPDARRRQRSESFSPPRERRRERDESPRRRHRSRSHSRSTTSDESDSDRSRSYSRD